MIKEYYYKFFKNILLLRYWQDIVSILIYMKQPIAITMEQNDNEYIFINE